MSAQDQKNIEKIFKDFDVSPSIQDYILGKRTNKDTSYFYEWDKLIKTMKKSFEMEHSYFIHLIQLFNYHNSYDFANIYFPLFKQAKNIEAVDYLVEHIDYDLPDAIIKYIEWSMNLEPVKKLIEHYHDQDLAMVEKLIESFESMSTTSSGGFEYHHTHTITNYLDAIKPMASDDFVDHLKIGLKNQYATASYPVYLRFFDTEEEKLEIIKLGLTKALTKLYANQATQDAIIQFIETGEKVKTFDKLVKKLNTEKKAYIYDDFTDFIAYAQPDKDNTLTQRLIEVSMKIDRYRTIQKLLFVVYKRKFTKKVNMETINQLTEDWDAIHYDDLISFLTYHVAEYHYGLNADKLFKSYMQEDFSAVLKALKSSSGKGLEAVLETVYKHNKKEGNQFILDNITLFTGKKLIAKVISILLKNKENIPSLLTFTQHKKSNVREIAIKALIQVDNKENISLLESLRDKEKSKAITTLLNDYLGTSATGSQSEADYYSKAEILKRADNTKLQITYFQCQTPLVWKEDQTELPESFTKHFVYLLTPSKKILKPTEEAKKIASFLTRESLQAFFAPLTFEDYKYQDWYLIGLPFTQHDDYLNDLKAYVNQLIYSSRGATAAKMVDVITAFKTTKAVQLLDFLSLKKNAKDARVNRAAVASMDAMAKEMNLSKEDLLDFIIPDFGFDAMGRLELDFGPRQFEITLSSDLALSIKDKSTEKTYKNLPKVGKNDDAEKGNEATKRFKAIKKDLKKQVKLENERLERGFSEARFWTGENWLKLFVNNPIMRKFAMNLIWGKYTNGQLTESFRYLDDGSFSNIEDEETNIQPQDSISLLHPVELKEEELNIWKEALEDYEIEQPFEQINRPIYCIGEDKKTQEVLDDFKGFMLPRFTLKNNLFKHGWERGVVEDAGCFYYYDKGFQDGTFASLDFLGDYVGNYDDNKEVPIYDITLTKNGKKIKPSELSPRLYSELYHELKKITEKGSGFNENWEKESW